MTDLQACALLTGSLIRRLLREGLVVRSLIWPSTLASGVLLLTLAVVALVRTSGVVAVAGDAPAAVRDAVVAEGWVVVTAADAAEVAARVRDGDAWAGTDGSSLWLRGDSADALVLEARLRALRGSAWTPSAVRQVQGAATTTVAGARIVKLLLPLFALYGVVFGLGMVARDRDDGTLDAELSLPIARWVPGAARWLAGTAVLTAFVAYSVAVFDAILGVAEPGALVRHGFAATGSAVALGIGATGQAGMRQGFSGPLAFSLTAAAGLMALGAGSPVVGQFLPLGSIGGGGSGWVPAALTLVAGVVASAGFAWRSARA